MRIPAPITAAPFGSAAAPFKPFERLTPLRFNRGRTLVTHLDPSRICATYPSATEAVKNRHGHHFAVGINMSAIVITYT